MLPKFDKSEIDFGSGRAAPRGHLVEPPGFLPENRSAGEVHSRFFPHQPWWRSFRPRVSYYGSAALHFVRRLAKFLSVTLHLRRVRVDFDFAFKIIYQVSSNMFSYADHS